MRDLKGLKPTNIPLLYEVNYPEQSQVGYLVKGLRRGRRFHELFNISRYASKGECFKAAASRAKTLHELYPTLTRREYAQVKRKNWKNETVGVRKCLKKRLVLPTSSYLAGCALLPKCWPICSITRPVNSRSGDQQESVPKRRMARRLLEYALLFRSAAAEPWSSGWR